jgi:carboxyl-terminal processing protease
MNREKLAWTASVVLLVVLAFQIPGTLAQRDDDYTFVRTLIDIHRRVVDNYVEAVDEPTLNEGAIDGMLAQLDPFSVFVPPAREEDFDRMLSGSFKGVGIRLDQHPDGTIEIVTPVDGSPAARSGILPGDILLKVNNESLDGIRLIDLIKKISGPIGSQITLTVRHYDGKEAAYTLTREEIDEPTVKGYQRKQDQSWDYYLCDDPKIAYIQLTQFTGSSYKELRTVFEQLLKEGMKGTILDLRFNPGGQLDQAEEIINMLVDKGQTIVTTRGLHRPEQRRIADGENPLQPAGAKKFPLMILVNEHSASAAEIVSGSLMDNRRAVVIGERTYGKGSVQEVIPLDEQGGELKLTVAYYYLPSGRLVHRKKGATDWGVIPQIHVPMDSAQQEKVLEDRDAQEMFRRPLPKTTTAAVPGATTQPLADVQLQAAINTMLGVLVFDTQPKNVPTTAMKTTTQPTTAPAK